MRGLCAGCNTQMLARHMQQRIAVQVRLELAQAALYNEECRHSTQGLNRVMPELHPELHATLLDPITLDTTRALTVTHSQSI